ncbi:MAG: hypothetical protein ABIK92_02755 [Pseudomonadota bacterium]
MEEIEPKVYEIETSFRKLTAISSWISLAFPILFIALPFVPDNGPTINPIVIYSLSILGALFFLFITCYLFRIKKQLPFRAISIDNDGIWPLHKEKKESLISWKSIANIKERPAMQRLDLIGQDGSLLLKIEYQLENFDRLRNLLIDRIDIKQYQYLPIIFSKKIIYHLFYFICILGLLSLGWHVGQKRPVFGYGAAAILAIGICYEYFTTIWCLSIDHHELSYKYPLLSRHVQYRDVIKVNLSDTFVNGARLPEVYVDLKNDTKPIKLEKLGVDAVILYKTLNRIFDIKSADLRNVDQVYA